MSDLPTQQELFRVARDEMLAQNGGLTRAVIERPGSDTNVLTAGASAVGDECVGQLAMVEAALYLDSAKGKKLDRLVFDRYGLTRKPATPAVGSVEFRTTVATGAAFAIAANTRLQTADGRAFITTAAATFPMGSVGPITVAVRSTLAGLTQQAREDTITSLLDRLVGAPADLTVNNPLATAGADDEETDQALRDRARQFFTTARRGTLGAIQAAALAVPGVRTATAFEDMDVFGRPAKSVQLVISDAFTEQLLAIAPTPAAYATQSQVLAANVFAGLSDTRAAGIYVRVVVGAVVLQGVQLGLRFHAGVDVDAVALQARAIVVSTINALSPGRPLTVAAIVKALRLVAGLIVTGEEVISPVGDVVPAALEVLRSTLGLVVAVAMQPDVALINSANPDAV